MVLHLELLVVAAALVGGPSLQNFAQAVEDFRVPPRFLANEIVYVVDHKV